MGVSWNLDARRDASGWLDLLHLDGQSVLGRNREFDVSAWGIQRADDRRLWGVCSGDSTFRGIRNVPYGSDWGVIDRDRSLRIVRRDDDAPLGGVGDVPDRSSRGVGDVPDRSSRFVRSLELALWGERGGGDRPGRGHCSTWLLSGSPELGAELLLRSGELGVHVRGKTGERSRDRL